jgi:putative PIN family toxin of toxin-antitoxin system
VIVVLDTNVWVSGLQFGGTPGRAIDQALIRDQLAISEFIRNEIVRVLTRKFARDPSELNVRLNELLVQALLIEVTGEIAGICRDPKDDAILETAWKAGADVLVAGDKDLLSLGFYKGAAIITPAEYAGRP